MLKRILVVVLATVASGAQAADDWIDLFDGKTTGGWTPRAKAERFEAKNGELHLLANTNCWVTTEIEMSDFIAELEVLMPPEAGFNSGFAFRCKGAKGKPKGYQVEIDRDKPAGIFGIGTGGWLYPTKQTEAAFGPRPEISSNPTNGTSSALSHAATGSRPSSTGVSSRRSDTGRNRAVISASSTTAKAAW